ncbi:hypothetical protein UT300019_16120 [Clostridium sp. CTA-19]
MKDKILNISIFILSLICLLISLKLFWNIGIYVDKFNTSPDVVLGGDLWLSMDWARLGFSAILCVLSGVNLFKEVGK